MVGIEKNASMNCKVCLSPVHPLASATLLGKYDVQYFQCQNCGFVQTEDPYWLDEAYSDAITRSDLGLVGRNVGYACMTRAVISVFFNRDDKFLDYGGGYGILVRLMRDYGFDFYRYDKYCPNLFAQGFDAETEGRNQYGLVTAFEVFEHLTDPLKGIDHMLRFSRSILFSTELFPSSRPMPDEWWYYGAEHGQHVSLYTRRALVALAKKFNVNLYTDGKSIHLLSEKKIPAWLFRTVSNHRLALGLGSILPKRSLLAEDYHRVTGKNLSRMN